MTALWRTVLAAHALGPDHFVSWMPRLVLRMQCHDEPAPGTWLCGECPYMNHGVICTKCGAPRFAGVELTGPVADGIRRRNGGALPDVGERMLAVTVSRTDP